MSPAHVFLETERLSLRRFTPADLDALVELDSDPDVMRYLSGTPTPREVLERDILPTFLTYRGDLGFYAVIEKAGGTFVGWIGLRPTTDRAAELGYRLRRPVWGRGYATEGSRALIAKAFTEFGVERITATTYEENVASRRVMEKCGLRFVRAFRVSAEDLAASDTFHTDAQDMFDGDDVEYALDRGDLSAGGAPSPAAEP
jgi:RimJ/RimL family protein N-acetyltransferase